MRLEFMNRGSLTPWGPYLPSPHLKKSNSSFIVRFCWNLKNNISICLSITIEIETKCKEYENLCHNKDRKDKIMKMLYFKFHKNRTINEEFDFWGVKGAGEWGVPWFQKYTWCKWIRMMQSFLINCIMKYQRNKWIISIFLNKWYHSYKKYGSHFPVKL